MDGVRSMKIALLVKQFKRTGGKERYVVELARSLSSQGHDVHVYAYSCDTSLVDGITFHQVTFRLSFSSILNTLSFIGETRKMLIGEVYDIIHSHERNYLHEFVTLHSLTYCEGIEKYPFFRGLVQKYFSLRSWLYLWLEKKQMKSPWLVAVSKEVSRGVAKHYGRSHQIRIIAPGVDTVFFDPAVLKDLRESTRLANKVEKNELAILLVGSAFQRKGVDRILPFLQGNRRLFVVGKGDNIAKYKALIRRMGLEQRVIFTGMIQDVRHYYALADVVVLPSRSEAFGMSVLEGMACGLPVIVSRNSGVSDLIEHNVNGLVMREDSELGLYFEQLAARKERVRLGDAARQTAVNYGWERVGAAHETLYRQVLANGRIHQGDRREVF